MFSGLGVQRLRGYLNAEGRTMFNDSEEPEMIVNVTAQGNGMALEADGDMDDDFGNESEMMRED